MTTDINLRQVRCFLAVAEELSFRRAADRLFMTQPPLSRHISALEGLLGCQLFLRDRQSVQLTACGHAFVPRARALVQAHEEIGLFLPASPQSNKVLRVGVTTALESDFFTSLGPLFESLHPDCRVQFKRQISILSVRDVGRSSLDLALVGLPVDTKGLSLRRLFDDPLCVAMSASHPLSKRRSVSLHDLKDDALFWFDRKLNPAYHDHCMDVFSRNSYQPRRLAEPPEHHVLLGMVAAHRGIAFIPRSLCAMQRKNVVYKTLREADQFSIGFGVVWSASKPVGLIAAFLASMDAGHAKASLKVRKGRSS